MLLKQTNGDFVIPGSTVKGRVRYYCKEFISNSGIFKEQEIKDLFGDAGDEARGMLVCAFSDLKTSLKKNDDYRFTIRNGIQISRNTRTTKPHALFNTEIVEYSDNLKSDNSKSDNSKSIFSGEIIYSTQNKDENKIEKNLVLLLSGLRLLSKFGGSKTSGFGKCEVPFESIQVFKNGSKIDNLQEFIAKHLDGENL